MTKKTAGSPLTLTLIGHWKSQWKLRRDQFTKEVDKIASKSKKKDLLKNFWAHFKNKKVAPETAAEKAFGVLDNAYAALGKVPQEKRIDALIALEKIIVKAEIAGKKRIEELKKTAKSELPRKQMTPQEIKDQDKDLKSLFAILDKDLDAMISAARSALVGLEQETKDDGSKRNPMASLTDLRVRKAELTANIKRSGAWIAKQERAPDVKEFNSKMTTACRNVEMQVRSMRACFDKGSRDDKFLKKASDALSPWAHTTNRKIEADVTSDDGKSVDVAAANIRAELRKATLVFDALTKWVAKV